MLLQDSPQRARFPTDGGLDAARRGGAGVVHVVDRLGLTTSTTTSFLRRLFGPSWLVRHQGGDEGHCWSDGGTSLPAARKVHVVVLSAISQTCI